MMWQSGIVPFIAISFSCHFRYDQPHQVVGKIMYQSEAPRDDVFGSLIADKPRQLEDVSSRMLVLPKK